MDIFVEQIVKKESSGKDTVLKLLIGIGMAVLLAVCVFVTLCTYWGSVAILVAFGICFGGYYLLTNFNCEYEYIVTNGEIDIDKIVAQRKRIRLITAKASTFEAFGEYKDAPEAASDVTVVMATGINESSAETSVYYADFKHSSAGNVRLVFSPEEKVVEAISPFLPRQLKINLRK